MENINDECRTEILVDLKEADSVFFHGNCVKIKESADYQKSVKYFENEENDMCEIGQEKYECILDMSPLRLRKGCKGSVQSINSDEALKGCTYDCPTAVLIDVPYNSNLSPKQYSFFYENNDFLQENKSYKCDNVSEGVAEQANVHACEKEYSAIKDSKDPHGLIAEKNEVSPPRLRWKTPSPQSMSRISKEASKVIFNLNSSTLFKEDISLCEEILPLPINFDNFDLDDNSDEDLTSNSEKFCEDNVSKLKLSVSIQTEEEKDCSKAVNEVSGICSPTAEDNLKNPPDKKSSTQMSTEQNDSDMSYESHNDSNKSDFSSKELKSSDIQSDSLSNNEISPCKEGPDEVFIKSNILSEDKENIQGREHKKNISSAKLVSSKAGQKNLLLSKMKLQNRDTLKNLSNIKHAIDSKNLTYTSKKNALSHLKQHNEVKVKEFLTPQKQQLKKTTSMEPQTEPKKVYRTSSLQYKGRRESICSFQEPHSVKQKASALSTSMYKSSSSDDKNVYSQMKTPSRRYSIATPLKSASAKKPPLTPAPCSFQKPSVSKFTPQPGRNRLSFSKSWQQSSNVPNLKGFQFQNPTHVSSAVPKPSFGMYSSKAVNIHDLSQTISSFRQIPGKIAVSTSGKKRVCSKLSLPSPLPVEQDRKLVRALFPSFPPK